MKKWLSIVSAAALLSSTASAYDTSWITKDASIGAFASTLGLGIDYQKRIGEKLALRLTAGGFTYDYDTTVDNVDYSADLTLLGIGLTLDYHPFASGFYLSAGVYYNGNEFDFSAQPNGGTYTFNGRTYNAADVGRVDGTSDLNTFAPFLGVGYDASLFKEGKLFLSLKAGALYQGTPTVNLTATCGPAIAGTTQCTQLQQDVEAEEKNLNNDIEDYKWWPVISFGLTYRF